MIVLPIIETSEMDREGFFGGSDIPHLIRLAPWGCDRRLFYEKCGIPPNFPFSGNQHTTRGHWLEPVAAEIYAKATGRALRRQGFKTKKNADWAAVHLDRAILSTNVGGGLAGPGVLEIKCPAREGFARIKAAGIPLEYQVQVQWGLAVTGWDWGSVAVFHADSWTLLYEDFIRDQELIDLLLEKAESTWEIVTAFRTVRETQTDLLVDEHMPERLDQGDRRCKRCPWRTTCQGMMGEGDESEAIAGLEFEVDPAIGPMLQKYLEANDLKKDAEELEKESKAELLLALDKRKAVQVPGVGRVVQTVVNRKEYVSKACTFQQLRAYPEKRA